MSTSRDAFEAWRSRGAFPESNLLDRCSDGAPRAGEYRNLRVHDDWEVWQASRAATLEETAQACEALGEGRHGRHDDTDNHACASAIRALASGTKEGQEPC